MRQCVKVKRNESPRHIGRQAAEQTGARLAPDRCRGLVRAGLRLRCFSVHARNAIRTHRRGNQSGGRAESKRVALRWREFATNCLLLERTLTSVARSSQVTAMAQPEDHLEPGSEGPRDFRTTHWSVVL